MQVILSPIKYTMYLHDCVSASYNNVFLTATLAVLNILNSSHTILTLF